MSKEESKSKIGYLRYAGILLFLVGLIFLIATFQPIISSYIDYYFSPKPIVDEMVIEVIEGSEEITKDIKRDTEIVFVDNEFGLYIPKIKANAKVIKNVDPFDEDKYRNALIYGIAHAQGSNFPNESGNVFLFAHSTVNFYERRKYNVYFYLLGELELGDEIYVGYDNKIYEYSVLEVKIVNPNEIQYMEEYMEEDTLTLMTCWPVGSNIRRLIVTTIRGIE